MVRVADAHLKVRPFQSPKPQGVKPPHSRHGPWAQGIGRETETRKETHAHFRAFPFGCHTFRVLSRHVEATSYLYNEPTLLLHFTCLCSASCNDRTIVNTYRGPSFLAQADAEQRLPINDCWVGQRSSTPKPRPLSWHEFFP
jgi:hypothetical protein